MPDARPVAIGKAIVAELNDAARAWQVPAPAFTATRHYLPIFTREQVTSLTVTVTELENEQDNAPESNRSRQDAYAINIVIQKAVDPADTAAIDALVYTCQQIHDFYERLAAGKRKELSIAGYRNVWSEDPKWPEIYDPELLDEERIFRSVIELTIVHWRKEAGGTP